MDNKDSEPLWTDEDWNLYQARRSVWRKGYMKKLLDNYRKIIDSAEDPEVTFWKLRNRLAEDTEHVGVSADMRKSQLIPTMAVLLHKGIIRKEELKDYSEKLQRAVLACNPNVLRGALGHGQHIQAGNPALYRRVK